MTGVIKGQKGRSISLHGKESKAKVQQIEHYEAESA
jgi:hypothetical protein